MSFITNVIDNVKSKFGKQSPVQHISATTDQETKKIPDQFDFMEHYTFIDPRKVMIDYDLFSLCSEVPVACETEEKSTTGFQTATPIPTKIALDFIHMLKATPAEKIEPKAMRTISIIHTKKGKSIVIMPDLQFKTNVIIWDTSAKPGTKGTWFLDTTPEINRAIVEATKIHTRQTR